MTITAPTSTSTSTTSPTGTPAPERYQPRVLKDGCQWILRTGPDPDPDEILEIMRRHLETHAKITLITPSGRQCHFVRHPAYPHNTKDPLGDQVRTVQDVLDPHIPPPLPPHGSSALPYETGAHLF